LNVSRIVLSSTMFTTSMIVFSGTFVVQSPY